MALQQRQGQPKEESIELVEDIRQHWRQPKLLLSRFQTWVTQQPIAVEALVATLAGSGQVGILSPHSEDLCVHLSFIFIPF